MLRRYIESRERHFHGRDPHRTSLPFLCEPGVPAFAAKALENSDTFFSYEPTTEYSLEAGILRFPSAVETAYAENNTVWGRFFEGSSGIAVVVLPQWNCDWDGHVKLCKLMQRSGISSVRLSLPYHHYRKPSHLKRPEYMVSPDLGQTLESARQAVLDARRTADWLLLRGYRKIAILGTSIGSCIAFLTLSHDRRFSSGTFIHVSSYFSDVVWEGLSTKHVRHSLEDSIAPDDLRKIWAPISPFSYVKRLQGADQRILMFAGRYDPTFLPRLSQQAFDEFDRCKVPYELHWLRCGHYTMGRFPFNAVVARNILKFLKRERDRM